MMADESPTLVRLPVLALLPVLLLGAPLSAQNQTAPTAAQLDTYATKVDHLVDQDLARHGLKPNPKTDDETFVRRAYLEIVGRVPTVGEARAFLDSKDPKRRDALIDELLASPGHTSHEVQFWVDLFRAKSRLQNRVSGEPFQDYLRQCVVDDRPYDVMVREMLTATGPAAKRGNGATGYLLRDLGMPADSMANTLRVFLGTRMECAQCHDHPFDRWKQREFYEMEAFFGGLRYRSNTLLQSGEGREIVQLSRELRQQPNGQQALRALRRMFVPLAVGLDGTGTGVTRLPDDYRGDDLKPGSFVAAHAVLGEQVNLPAPRPLPTRNARFRRRNNNNNNRNAAPTHMDIGSRDAFANWLVSPENPRFTTTIANRMWKRAFGVGLIEPVDDIRDDTVASDPELMAFLEKTMVELDYDLRAFQAVLMRTNAWQRTASVHDESSDEPYRFTGPALRRLSAEQLWDSFLTLTIDDVDGTIAPPGAAAERVYRQYDELANLSGDQLKARVERETLRYTDPKEYRRMLLADRMSMSPQGAGADRPDVARARELFAQIRQARQDGDLKRARELSGELRAMRRPRGMAQRGLVRASELPSPAPAGHFLREFGQSDLEQSDNSFDDANVPQALALMNGIVDGQVLDRRSTLSRALAAAKDHDDLIRTAFLAILTRDPSREELAEWRRSLAQDERGGTRDLVWTLCNTNEFRFLQ